VLEIILSCLTISLALAGLGALVAKLRHTSWKRWFCGTWRICFLLLVLLSMLYFSVSSPTVQKSYTYHQFSSINIYLTGGMFGRTITLVNSLLEDVACSQSGKLP
jgi:DMSO reductase anchor subunit